MNEPDPKDKCSEWYCVWSTWQFYQVDLICKSLRNHVNAIKKNQARAKGNKGTRRNCIPGTSYILAPHQCPKRFSFWDWEKIRFRVVTSLLSSPYIASSRGRIWTHSFLTFRSARFLLYPLRSRVNTSKKQKVKGAFNKLLIKLFYFYKIKHLFLEESSEIIWPKGICNEVKYWIL